VNLASRITDYARPGEVLVSKPVVEWMGGVDGVTFDWIGPVALKGVSEPIELFAAHSNG
jgi:class 3 adenylate cyclase